MSIANLVNTTIDDRDERIQYSSAWSHLTGGSQFNNTVTLTRSAGASASFDFSRGQALVHPPAPRVPIQQPKATDLIHPFLVNLIHPLPVTVEFPLAQL
ncbi:hypothetical protein M422DRAFT_37608 [Sphaerobolus stellatus SS14]|uniref:Uncharacterized protein n=1 Tax=Sphaerobolus stellatus (strain SS14) TaxID=990650 RepID=A0A0C9UFH7_SPHS4|nr:hypothetical protein M422DRAFT_37608 [Sphaerobolus stellatus SS14]